MGVVLTIPVVILSMFFKKLIGLQARTAHVLRGGREIDLPIEQVLVSEEIIVRVVSKIM